MKKPPLIFWSNLTLAITLVGFLGSGLTLHLIEIDNSLVTNGKTVSKGRTALIRHREGHRLIDIYIQPGTFVRNGDPLFKFDTAELDIQAKNLAEQQAIMTSRMGRLQKELLWLASHQKGGFLPASIQSKPADHIPFLTLTSPAPDVSTSFLDQSLLHVNQQTLLSEITSLHQQKQEMTLLLTSMLARHDTMKDQHSLLIKDQKTAEHLAKKGIMTKAHLRQKKLQSLSQKSNLHELEADILQSKQKLTIIDHQIKQIVGTNAQSILDELQIVEKQASELRFQIRNVAQQLNNSIVRATLSGWVENMVDLSTGRTIAPNEILCVIVASDDIQVDFTIPPHKRGLVTVNAPLRLQVNDGSAPLPVSYHGQVNHISADIRSGEEAPHYQATAQILAPITEESDFAHHIRPGLPVTIAVRGEPQSVLAYITAPLTRFWDAAFQ